MLSIVKSLKQKLSKSKSSLIDKIAETVQAHGVIDDEMFEEIEEILIKNDTGTDMADLIIERLKQDLRRDRIKNPEVVKIYLCDVMQDILMQDVPEDDDFFALPDIKPFVIAFVGVNGTGKTTTIGKVANRFAKAGKKVLIVAGETFRAAAIDQVAIWADRAGVDILRTEPERDPASVIYEGVAKAVAKLMTWF
jgi:fused signal recognition particle receptor